MQLSRLIQTESDISFFLECCTDADPLCCDPLALVESLTPVECNTHLLETMFEDESVFVFPEDVSGSANLTFLSSFLGMDKAKITRKRLKPGKLEHGNGRARKKPKGSYQSQKVNSQSTKVKVTTR
ncbi:hypothetical protein Tco_0028386 [Tanacetum coccineum]